ncbi:MAG: zinc ribbon domain-containing protein [Candidatus Paceibacterota bacterium]|jgi:uncharacterized membrane protein YvbJ
MESTFQKRCPKCNTEVSHDAYFCLHCGEPLKEGEIDISVAKQIRIYLVSFFLAPFGIGYVIKYLKQKEEKPKVIGVIALILTILAIVVVVYLTQKTFEQYSQLELIGL